MKFKELKNMPGEERNKKLQELKMELVKSNVGSEKSTSKTRQIRKMIARILTLQKEDTLKNKHGNMSKMRSA